MFSVGKSNYSSQEMARKAMSQLLPMRLHLPHLAGTEQEKSRIFGEAYPAFLAVVIQPYGRLLCVQVSE